MKQQKTVQLKWVALASLLNNTGATFIWPLTTMYVNKYLGQTLTTAGVVMLMISVAMMIGNYTGGMVIRPLEFLPDSIVRGCLFNGSDYPAGYDPWLAVVPHFDGH